MTWKTPSYRYRVNFGNGQVYDVESKAAAFHYIAETMKDDPYQAYAFVEWQDPETRDWFRTGTRP